MQPLELLREAARRQLETGGIAAARESVDILLAAALGRDRAFLHAHPEYQLNSRELACFTAWMERRLRGEPAQYILGRQEFYGREFEVSPAVLIPRPETELLVEAALEKAGALRGSSAPVRIVDVGTGSGCIAITLALELAARGQAAGILAADISPAALALAEKNARRWQAAVEFQPSDWLDAWREQAAIFDLIVSNPPYIPESELDGLQREVREYEPRVALLAGETGLENYARLLPAALRLLAPGGWLILEMGYRSAAGVRDWFADWAAIETRFDLQGWPRVMLAGKKPLDARAMPPWTGRKE